MRISLPLIEMVAHSFFSLLIFVLFVFFRNPWTGELG